MRHIAARIAIGGLTFVAMACLAAAIEKEEESAFSPPEYRIERADRPLTIDGKLDEPAWFAAHSIGMFHFPWFQSGEKEQSVAKLLWDDDYLYVGHVCQDAHITARHLERDGDIPKDDCFEIMLSPNAERPSFYYNVEWNVIGGFVDNHRPNGAQGPRVKWDAEGVRIAGTYRGTLNDDSDRDEYWVVEVAIPLRNFRHAFKHFPPQTGDEVRMNFNRHGGATNLQYSQWSPGDTPSPAFHTPHRFGRGVFSDRVNTFPVGGAP